jgi:hypothetical protein
MATTAAAVYQQAKTMPREGTMYTQHRDAASTTTKNPTYTPKGTPHPRFEPMLMYA